MTRGWMGDTSGGDWGPDDGPDDDYCGATETEVIESLQEEVADGLAQIKKLKTDNATLRNELTAARLELDPLRRQNERLADALYRHGCYCGRQGRDLILHATWCPYRKACAPHPKAD